MKRALTGRKRSPGAWLCAAALLAAAPVSAGSDDLTTTAVKRFFLASVDQRCHLLQPAAAMAVTAGYLQARNASIRANGNLNALGPWLDQARTAAHAIACDAPQLRAQATAAQDAYRAYVTQMHINLPGSQATWTGTRAFGDNADWRLAQYQSSSGGDAVLGLYGTLSDPRFVVMAHFADGATPYSARLLVRDSQVVQHGLINRQDFAVTDTVPFGFGGNTTISFMARDSEAVQARLRPEVKTNIAGFSVRGDYVGTQGPVDAIRFDFPTTAWRAMAPLDPREDVVVAFDFRDGTRYVRFEVGDFLTGLSYVNLPSPYGGKIG